jgi:hypothetical protein
MRITKFLHYINVFIIFFLSTVYHIRVKGSPDWGGRLRSTLRKIQIMHCHVYIGFVGLRFVSTDILKIGESEGKP